MSVEKYFLDRIQQLLATFKLDTGKTVEEIIINADKALSTLSLCIHKNIRKSDILGRYVLLFF